jgi:hypothetical protein
MIRNVSNTVHGGFIMASKIFSKVSALIMVLALILIVAPNVTHADSSGSSITFGANLQSPTPTPLYDGVIFVSRNFNLSVAVTSVNEISKVTVEVEDFKADMVFSNNAYCKLCVGYIAEVHLGSESPNGKKSIVVTATDVNGYSAIHTYYVVLGDPSYPTALLSLEGEGSVKSNQPFNLIYKLDSVYQNVYGQDVSVTFDNTMVDFISAESLKNELKILSVKNTENKTRMIISSIGQKSDLTNGLIKLHFKAKTFTQQTSTSITLETVKVSDDNGNEFQVNGSNLVVVIGSADKTLLNNTIAVALSVYGAATEGNTAGNYPFGSKAILKAVIDKSKIVSTNDNAIQSQVDLAKSELETAISIFQNSIITSIPTAPIGDLNNDSVISIGDVGIMSSECGKSTASSDWNLVKAADLNHDGKIDIEDLILLAKLILGVL